MFTESVLDQDFFLFFVLDFPIVIWIENELMGGTQRNSRLRIFLTNFNTRTQLIWTIQPNLQSQQSSCHCSSSNVIIIEISYHNRFPTSSIKKYVFISVVNYYFVVCALILCWLCQGQFLKRSFIHQNHLLGDYSKSKRRLTPPKLEVT